MDGYWLWLFFYGLRFMIFLTTTVIDVPMLIMSIILPLLFPKSFDYTCVCYKIY